jgi:Mn2+/Fe2+ NRAMP family transporter
MGGFLNLRLKKWMRSLITRRFQIPFALIPLITLVSKEQVMGVFKIGPKTNFNKSSHLQKCISEVVSNTRGKMVVLFAWEERG